MKARATVAFVLLAVTAYVKTRGDRDLPAPRAWVVCPTCDVPLDGGAHESWCERTAGGTWSL